ncbi:hypothetical protein TCAL_08209 [Tigriopus californicus]|uniref:LITAF domain-containing protein n=1 Tax=Tigriopus californicus TaxID=6832 RepID=A0A553NC19_TIGCA|nr:cell death-inducing p53-target protein 1 homolog [Tigriopus californicus]TRY62909.1 hypothetical protein TCAL_08209 [Tigriopus californicus]
MAADKGWSMPPTEGTPPDAPPSYEQTQAAHGAAKGYAYPQQPPPQQQPNTSNASDGRPVIVQYVNAPNFGHRPVNMVCPHCQSQICTSTESEPGAMAWVLAGVLCVVGLWPCACIPCCIDSLNSVTHKCPNCRNFLGRYKGGF